MVIRVRCRRTWLATDASGSWTATEWDLPRQTMNSVSTFGVDEDGVLYMADLDQGAIYRIVMADEVFGDGFESVE